MERDFGTGRHSPRRGVLINELPAEENYGGSPGPGRPAVRPPRSTPPSRPAAILEDEQRTRRKPDTALP